MLSFVDSAAHATEFVGVIAPFKGTKFDMGHAPVGREQWDFAWQLEPLMNQAGWEFVEWSGGNNFGKINWTTKQHLYGVANVTNVSVEFDERGGVELVKAIIALATAFNKIGINAVATNSNNDSPNKNIVHLLIGEKQ